MGFLLLVNPTRNAAKRYTALPIMAASTPNSPPVIHSFVVFGIMQISALLGTPLTIAPMPNKSPIIKVFYIACATILGISDPDLSAIIENSTETDAPARISKTSVVILNDVIFPI